MLGQPLCHLNPNQPKNLTLQVQLGDKLALVREGRVVHVLATADSSLFPRVAAVRPLVAEPDAGGAATVSVWGYNLGQEEDTLLARSNGEGPLRAGGITCWARGLCCARLADGAACLGHHALVGWPASITSVDLLPANPHIRTPAPPPPTAGAYVEVERLGLEADPAWRGMQVGGRASAGPWVGGPQPAHAACSPARSPSCMRPFLRCMHPSSHGASSHALATRRPPRNSPPHSQRLDLRLTGVTSPGAVQLEVMRGGYISASKVGGGCLLCLLL